jgi:hypothetical protein
MKNVYSSEMKNVYSSASTLDAELLLCFCHARRQVTMTSTDLGSAKMPVPPSQCGVVGLWCFGVFVQRIISPYGGLASNHSNHSGDVM